MFLIILVEFVLFLQFLNFLIHDEMCKDFIEIFAFHDILMLVKELTDVLLEFCIHLILQGLLKQFGRSHRYLFIYFWYDLFLKVLLLSFGIRYLLLFFVLRTVVNSLELLLIQLLLNLK